MAVSVRALLDTVVQALPEVGNLGLLFFLLFYIFAALGVELFGRVGKESSVHASSQTAVVLVVQRFGVGLMIERLLVRLPAGALSSQLGQLSFPSCRFR